MVYNIQKKFNLKFLKNGKSRNIIIFVLLFIIVVIPVLFKKKPVINEGFHVMDIIDSRVFYLDKDQWTPGIRCLLKNLETTNVTGFKISGFPLYWCKDRKKYFWYHNTDYLLKQAINEVDNKNIFLPFISCIYNSNISYRHVKKLLEDDPTFWKGLGPIFINNKFMGETYQNIYDTFEARSFKSPYFQGLMKLALEYNMPVAIDYNFTNVNDKLEIEDILDPEDDIEANMGLYEEGLAILEVFKKYPNIKFILHFSPIKNIKVNDNNRLENKNNITLISFILSKYPNVTIDLSGDLLMQAFKTEHVEKIIVDKGMNMEQRKQVFQSGLNDIRGPVELLKLIFKPFDDFLSGDDEEIPPTEKDYSTPSLGTRIKNFKSMLTQNAYLDKNGNPTDMGKQAFNNLSGLFQDDEEEEPSRRDININNTDKQIAKAKAQELVLQYRGAELDRQEKNAEKEILEEEEEPKVIQPKPKKYPKTTKRANIIKHGGPRGRELADELEKDEDDISKSKMKKIGKALNKKSKTKPLVPFIKFEWFTNPPPSLYSLGLDVGKSITTLPKNVPPPPGPLTEQEIIANDKLPKIPFTKKQLNLIKDINNYSKSGKVPTDMKRNAINIARTAVGEDEKGRTILERPEELYHAGLHQYLTPRQKTKYYYMYGPPEYEYIDTEEIIRRKRRIPIKQQQQQKQALGHSIESDIPSFQASNRRVMDKLVKENIQKENKKNKIRNKALEDPNVPEEVKEQIKKDRINSIYNRMVSSVQDDPKKEVYNIKHKLTKHEYILNHEWIKLISEYPDQFIIGTGKGIKLYEPQVVILNRIIAELEESVARKVARYNILKIIP